jgi:hypothetical protein
MIAGLEAAGAALGDAAEPTTQYLQYQAVFADSILTPLYKEKPIRF